MAKKTDAPMKKTDAVKAALDAGAETPEDGTAFIKEKFGLEVTKPQFSTYKSNMKAKGATRNRKPGRRVGARKAAFGGDGVNNGLVAIDDLEAAKSLVAKVGADQAKRLVGLFE